VPTVATKIRLNIVEIFSLPLNNSQKKYMYCTFSRNKIINFNIMEITIRHLLRKQLIISENERLTTLIEWPFKKSPVWLNSIVSKTSSIRASVAVSSSVTPKTASAQHVMYSRFETPLISKVQTKTYFVQHAESFKIVTQQTEKFFFCLLFLVKHSYALFFLIL
jgi:hypothetical protein